MKTFKEYLLEAGDDDHLYHVTHTKHVDNIKKKGILPLQTSNWVKAGDKNRYGNGEIYAFNHKHDAIRWAAKMDWAHHQKMGSGKISIVKVKKDEHKWDEDHNDPLGQSGKSGSWLKRGRHVSPEHIVSHEPVTSDHIRSLTLKESKTQGSTPKTKERSRKRMEELRNRLLAGKITPDQKKYLTHVTKSALLPRHGQL